MYFEIVTGNQYDPNKIELNHATDIMRHLTWDLGTIPTQEQKELFIKKMCSALILFPGSKRMNAVIDYGLRQLKYRNNILEKSFEVLVHWDLIGIRFHLPH